MNAFEAAEKNGKALDLQRELEDLFNSQNKSTDNNNTSIPATFLRVTVICWVYMLPLRFMLSIFFAFNIGYADG